MWWAGNKIWSIDQLNYGLVQGVAALLIIRVSLNLPSMGLLMNVFFWKYEADDHDSCCRRLSTTCNFCPTIWIHKSFLAQPVSGVALRWWASEAAYLPVWSPAEVGNGSQNLLNVCSFADARYVLTRRTASFLLLQLLLLSTGQAHAAALTVLCWPFFIYLIHTTRIN